MNETKSVQYRQFRATLKAVAASLGATAIHTPRMDEGVFRITLKADTNIALEVTYTNYTDHIGPRLYVDKLGFRGQTMLSNLTAANLTKHIKQALLAVQKNLTEIAEDTRKDTVTFAAEEQMAGTLTVQLKLDGFHALKNDDDYHIWRSGSLGTIKLAFVDALKNDEGAYEIRYNVEYDFTVSGVVVKGELDATTLSGILRTLKALYTL